MQRKYEVDFAMEKQTLQNSINKYLSTIEELNTKNS